MTKSDKPIRPTAQPATPQTNEGEGNRIAARAYNQNAEHFAKSGRVEKKAREAQQAVDGPEGPALARAEIEAQSHSVEASSGTSDKRVEAAAHMISKETARAATAMKDPFNAAQTAFAAMMPGKAMDLSSAGTAWMQWTSAMAEQLSSAAQSEMAIAAESLQAMSSCRSPVDVITMQSSFASAWFARAMSQSIALSALALAPIQRAANTNTWRQG